MRLLAGLISTLIGLLACQALQAEPAAQTLCPKPLIVGWDLWAPYHYLDAQGQITGASIAVVSEAARRVGCKLSFKQSTWPRLLRDIELGKVEIALEASDTPERRRVGQLSRSYNSSVTYLWTRRTTVFEPFADLEQLLSQKRRLGVQVGWCFGEPVDGQLKAASVVPGRIEYVRSELQNLDKLLAGRIDGYLGDWASTQHILKQNAPHAGIGSRSPALIRTAAHLLFSHRTVDPALVQAFNSALTAMEKDGTLPKLLNDHHALVPQEH